MAQQSISELQPEDLRRVCDTQEVEQFPSGNLPYLQSIIGQQRALEALEFGLGIRQKGFNIYVGGPPGTGKSTTVQTYLEEQARGRPQPPDYCYVYNFTEPDRPTYLSFPAGGGRTFRQEMSDLVERVRRELPQAFESDDYQSRQESISQAVMRQREELLTQLNQQAQQQGFALQMTQVGPLLVPLSQSGEPMSDQQFFQLSDETRQDIQQRREALNQDLKSAMKEIRRIEREAQERISHLNSEVADYVIGGLFEDLEEKYQDLPQVVRYLQTVRKDMVEHLGQFFPQQQGQGGQWSEEMAFRKYDVNVIVDNAETQGAPVVVEQHPTYPNLFGRIEKEAIYGALQTDFTLIKAGALLRANGGYLVLHPEDLVRMPFSYDALKRAITNAQTTIEDVSEQFGFMTTKSLRPEPIPLDVRVVLIGNASLYYLLYSLDEDFREVFKVRADFDSHMDRDAEGVLNYLNFVGTICHRESLRPLDTLAVGRLVEEGSRLAEDQRKLSARFGELADILREADYWATVDGASTITADHVKQAVEAKIYRSNLIEERIRELMTREIFLVDTEGASAGQVNGLSVLSLGDYSFGRPSRITATVGLGQGNLTDIEREAQLGGKIHTKGVLILAGYLSKRYGQDKPLNLSARLVFEQSYEEIEGDSASSTELYAILSSLSGLPIRQGFAVTGSVNQQGQVQAIGGVNQKIEGFYDLCRIRGLTGDQGVLIPASNAQHLMLRDDVVQAVRDGQFHIYPVETIDQGIEILTGTPAGEVQPDGSFPDGTVNALVHQRLHEMTETLRQLGSRNGASGAQQPQESGAYLEEE